MRGSNNLGSYSTVAIHMMMGFVNATITGASALPKSITDIAIEVCHLIH